MPINFNAMLNSLVILKVKKGGVEVQFQHNPNPDIRATIIGFRDKKMSVLGVDERRWCIDINPSSNYNLEKVAIELKRWLTEDHGLCVDIQRPED